jgi:phosphate transport system permease protein
MTDAAIRAPTGFVQRRVDTTSAEAQARIRRRYRAERRFRAYGLIAILSAALFLVVLIADIVIKAMPAVTQSALAIPVTISRELVDPQGTNEPRAIAGGDYDKIVREGLYALFPLMKTRAERRALNGVLSSGAADELRRMVVADPGLIGQEITAPVLLGSDADLYLKGIATDVQAVAGAGEATPSATTGNVTVFSTSNAFASQLQTVKKLLAENAEARTREADRLSLVVSSIDADLQAALKSLEEARTANDTTLIAVLEARAESLRNDKSRIETQAADLRAKAADLRSRHDSAGTQEQLTPQMPSVLVMMNDGVIKATSLGSDRIEGEVLIPLSSTAGAGPGQWQQVVLETPEDSRKIQDRSIAVLEVLKAKDVVRSEWNFSFFEQGDSREPELAGILGALVGSALTMLVTLVLCLPVGVMAAIYLEEFAPKNRLTQLIEVNINNLAAVPSIVFGLLGLAVFLNFFGLPRSAPLVGGLVLALLVLPTIIIASRAALKAVPPSIREAALGVGASKQQAIFHHVLPLAMPGILTGTIIGMAHALGESAPLLLIGMVAFIVDVPSSVTTAATVLPVQIFLWSDLPEIGFQAKTALAIIVLLLFLFVMNGTAIWLRKRFERRW